MDVIDFRNQYNAGQATLGAIPPPTPPPILKYTYRAFPVRSGGSSPSVLLKYTYRAFPVLSGSDSTSILLKYLYRAFPAHSAGSVLKDVYRTSPIRHRNPLVPPIIQ